MEKVVSKKIEKSHEAGSGALYIPILGDIFPKIWGHKMKETNKYLVFTETYRYEVSEENYNKIEVGEDFNKEMSLFN